MSVPIPPSHRDLFDKKSLAYLACRLRDGSTLVNPVWCALEEDRVVNNSAEGRLKDEAMRRDPRVTLCIVDPESSFRYLEVRGKVMEITTDGAEEMIDKLAQRYLGVDTYPNRRRGEVRVIYRIEAEKASAFPYRLVAIGSSPALTGRTGARKRREG